MVREENSIISYSKELLVDYDEFEKSVKNAVAFFEQRNEFDKLVTADRLEIIFSSNYIEDRNIIARVPKIPKEKDVSSNGEYIPISNQKDTGKNKSIIIVNVKQVFKDKLFFKSVIVHELSHYYDERLLPEKLISSCEKESTRFMIFFHIYSEMRSKYYQETYIVKNCQTKISDHVEAELKKKRFYDDWYNIAHRWGQILCWEDNKEYSNLNKTILMEIDAEKYGLYMHNQDSILLPLIFDKKLDIEFQKICGVLSLKESYFKFDKSILDYISHDKLRNRLGENIMNELNIQCYED